MERRINRILVAEMYLMEKYVLDKSYCLVHMHLLLLQLFRNHM